jgi:hypothetical protein
VKTAVVLVVLAVIALALVLSHIGSGSEPLKPETVTTSVPTLTTAP